MGESKLGSKAPIIVAVIVIAAGLIALAVFSGPSLRAADKMSETFKKGAYEHWLSYHRFGGCVLPSEVKPQNTADQQVRDLFDQCFEYSAKKLGLSGKLPTDDLRRQYNDADDEEKRIKGQIDAIFRANGCEDADTTIRKRLKKVMPRPK